jgi:hypothetical protein
MGLLSKIAERLGDVAKGQAAGAGSASEREVGPIPDLAALVTDDEIEAVTGSRPQGEPRLNGPRGSEVDNGRLVIRESRLANGDEFLITLTAAYGEAEAQRAMDRMAELEKPLAGVGERGLKRIKHYKKTGKSEVGVTALSGRYTLSLTHTAMEGRREVDSLTGLLRTVLTRL